MHDQSGGGSARRRDEAHGAAPAGDENSEQATPSNLRPLHGSAADNLARAYRRALAEGLVAYPQPDGRWFCKHYAIDLTGPAPLDVDCDCADAVFRERLCKHAVCVVFCRLYGYLPCPPVAAGGLSILPDCVDDFVARLEESSGRLSA